jgi:hypothetical protein
MESLHAAVFDPEGINADGPDASVSSPSKRTSRDTILRMSNLIETTATGAQNLDATKAFHDWIIAKDIQSIAEAVSEHMSSDALSLLWDYETNVYDFEQTSVELSDWLSGWSEYHMEPYFHSWLNTHQSEDALRLIACIGLASAIWIPSSFTAGLGCTHPRFACEETTFPNLFFNTSWFNLLGHLNHPPPLRRLLDHHVRELPCANYPPAASGDTPTPFS